MVILAALLSFQAADKAALPLSGLLPGETLSVERTVPTRPAYAGMRLVVEERDKPAVVQKPDALVGKVRIATAEQALEYVRLLRSPGVWPFLFDKPILEVRRQPVLFRLPDWLYGDLRIYTVSGWDGVLSDRDWARLGLEDPKVTGGAGKDWTVRRPCLLGGKAGFETGILVERVSEAGRYVFSVERPDAAPRGVSWSITVPSRR